MDFQHIARQQRLDTHDTMAMKDATAEDWFNCFVRKTVAFRTKLGAGMEEGIRQFCPTDGEMIHYIERWIDEIREDRHIGYGDAKYIDGDDTGDKGATEYEILEKMLAFIEEETYPMVEMFGQIDNHTRPTIIQDIAYGQLLDFPYNGGVSIYQSNILDILAKCCSNLHTPCRAFVATLIVAEVEKWMTNFTIEYLTDKLKDTTAE